MMASYYLVALLATIYTIVIGLDSFVALKTNKPWKTFHSWFEQTLNSFLDASLLFSISLLLATIYRFATAAQQPDDGDNTFTYSLINAITVSIFSAFAPLLLQYTARGLRRRGMRAILWFVLIILSAVTSVMYYRWRGPGIASRFPHDDGDLFDLLNQTEYLQSQTVWLVYCDIISRHLIEVLDRAIIVAQVVLGVNLPCWIYLLLHIADSNQEDSDGSKEGLNKYLPHTCLKVRRYVKQARALNITIISATMWLLLGTFTAITVRLADAMGPWGKDRRWSIGQVLAMATFVPLLIDMIAIIICKSRSF